MSKFKIQNFQSTFKNANRGVRLVIKSERNLKIQLFVTVLVLLTALWLGFDEIKFCILLLTIGFVLVTEMLNTAVEFSLDSIYHNKYSKMVGMAKDIAAGAVMLSSAIAIAIGVILFGSAILDLFF